MAVIEAIATTYLEADAASVTFSSIPATYEHLQLRASMRTTSSGVGGYDGILRVQLNGATGAVYSYTRVIGGDPSYTGTSAAYAAVSTGDTYALVGYMPTLLEDAAAYGSVILDILDYANTNKNKTALCLGGYGMGDPDGEGLNMTLASMVWDSTAAVNAIKLFGHDSWVRGSEFTLYGLNSS